MAMRPEAGSAFSGLVGGMQMLHECICLTLRKKYVAVGSRRLPRPP